MNQDKHLLRRAVLGDMLTRNALRFPQKLAIIERGAADSRRTVTYSQLNQYVNFLANRWLDQKIEPMSVIAGMGKNGIDLVAAYFATIKCGCAFTMLNSAQTLDEIRYQMSDAQPATVAFEGNKSRSILSEMDIDVTSLDGMLDQSDATQSLEPIIFVDENWTAAIVYTSGTESKPKGVELTHKNFMVGTTPAWAYEGYLRGSDVFLLLAPFHTMAGIGTITNAMSMGSTLVVLDSTDADAVISAVEFERVTNMSQTPTFYRRMIESDKFRDADFSSLEQCHTYGGLNQASVFDAFVSKVANLTWATYWGQSELTQLGCIGWFRTIDDIPGGDLRWIGVPTSQLEIRIVDSQGNTAEVGEMIVRSPAVMKGYLRNEEKTREVIRNGWLHTGDIVRRDEDGNIFFFDRMKDVIKTGGVNVSSLEVEQVINELESVLEVAVVGVPDPEWSEAVTAFIVVNAGCSLDESTVISHCKSRQSSYKAPKHVIFCESLPKDLQGKIRKRVLRDGYVAI